MFPFQVCFKLGSFSDSCATAVVSNFEDIYAHLQENFNKESVCHVAGTCTERFHQHEPAGNKVSKMTEVEITPMGNIGKLPVEG